MAKRRQPSEEWAGSLGVVFGFLSEREVSGCCSVCRRWNGVQPVWTSCLLTAKNASFVSAKWTASAIGSLIVAGTFDSGMAARVFDLPNLRSLTLYDRAPALEYLKDLRTVRHLGLGGLESIPRFADLGSLPSLRELALNLEMTAPMSVESLSPLSQLPRLKRLFLYGCTHFVLTCNTTPPNLRILHLVNCSWPLMWEEISALNVTDLTLDETGIGDGGVVQLSVMPALRNLRMEKEDGVTGITLRLLRQVQCLTLCDMPDLVDSAFTVDEWPGWRELRIIDCTRRLTYFALATAAAFPGLCVFELRHWTDRFHDSSEFDRFLRNLGYQVSRLSELHVAATRL